MEETQIMNMPGVSIIIPTRNRAQLLLQTLRSAHSQTWREVEIVVVDEASTDDTVTQIGRHFQSVKVIRHETVKGPSAARNTGIGGSHGAWVFFLDDDDLLHPEHIRQLVEAAQTVPVGNAVSGRWRRFEESNFQHFGPVMCCPPNRSDDETLVEFLEPMGEGTICSHSAIWPRSLFERVAWDEELFTNGDVDFFGRAVLAGCHIYGFPVGMAYYRTHTGERVAGTASVRSLISAARYRLKWTAILASHPERERFAGAMKNGLMSLLITLSQHEAGVEWLPQLKSAYRAWGGKKYFLPLPPRNPFKRIVADTALKIGGPSAVGALLKLTPRRSALAQPALGSPNLADAEDGRVVKSFA